MAFMKPAHKDCINPPGQIVNPIPKTLAEDIADTEQKMKQEEKSLGQVAFEAYCKADWCEDIPWADLTYEEQQVWHKVARAVIGLSGNISCYNP